MKFNKGVTSMNISKCQSLIAMMVSLALPVLSWADISNTASAAYQDTAGNSYPVVNSNTVTVTVIQAPAITLTKSASPTTATSGTTVTFTIAYLNNGGNATNVVITDNVPAGSTLVPLSISASGSLTGSTITWTLGSIAGANGTVTFQVKVN